MLKYLQFMFLLCKILESVFKKFNIHPNQKNIDKDLKKEDETWKERVFKNDQ